MGNIAIQSYDEFSIFDSKTGRRLFCIPWKEPYPFGSTWDDEYFYMTYRRHKGKSKVNRWTAKNCIEYYDKSFKKVGEFPGPFVDLHQAVWHDNKLWVVSTGMNRIIICEKGEKGWSDCTKTPWDPNPRRKKPGDWNHFNSIYFEEEHVYLCAHNWNRPGEVWKFTYPDLEFVRTFQVGKNPHNVFRWKGKLGVISSGTGNIVLIDEDHPANRTRHNMGQYFVRGIAFSGDEIFVGCSKLVAERDKRMSSSNEFGKVAVLDHNFKRKRWLDVDKGVIWDIRTLDYPDPSHQEKVWHGAHGFTPCAPE